MAFIYQFLKFPVRGSCRLFILLRFGLILLFFDFLSLVLCFVFFSTLVTHHVILLLVVSRLNAVTHASDERCGQALPYGMAARVPGVGRLGWPSGRACFT
jgi:hypothetical protein